MKRKILIIGSSIDVPGGISTVIKNQLESDCSGYSFTHIATYKEGTGGQKIIFFIRALINIAMFVVRKRPEIIHIHVSERGSFWRKMCIICILKPYNGKLVLHHHGAEFISFYEALNPAAKGLVKWVLETVDVNIVLGNSIRRIMMQKISHKAVYKVIYNAVKSPVKNKYEVSGKGILFMSCFEKRKGIQDLTAVIRDLNPCLEKNILFYLCGEGRELEDTVTFIKKCGLEERVVFTGWINAKEKSEIFPKIALHILPSYNEGLPMSVLETMAYGIPNIASSTGAVSETITDGVNGWLFKAGDTGQLKDLILRGMAEEKLRREISIKAYETIKGRFTLERQMGKLKRCYDLLLKVV